MHSSWADWFINNKSNGAGNRNLQAFSKILGSGDSNEGKLWALVKEINTVILAADSNRNIMILHSPKNFSSTRSHPENNVVCMLGVGLQATCILLDLNMAFRDLQPVVPSVHNLAGCDAANKVTNISEPKESGVVGFKGSAIFFQVQFFGTELSHQTKRILSGSFPSPHVQQRALTKSMSSKQLQ